jgi:hypothetical protein
MAFNNGKHLIIISLKDFMNYNSELAETIFT